jgi:Rod binding domain-containing protein
VAAATPADAPIPPAAPSSRLDQAARQLDSVFLNEMLSHMTPDPSSRPDGSFAGGMWQSLLIQNVADQISKSGRFSLSRHLFNPGGTAHASADVAARTGSVWRVNDEKSI